MREGEDLITISNTFSDEKALHVHVHFIYFTIILKNIFILGLTESFLFCFFKGFVLPALFILLCLLILELSATLVNLA